LRCGEYTTPVVVRSRSLRRRPAGGGRRRRRACAAEPDSPRSAPQAPPPL